MLLGEYRQGQGRSTSLWEEFIGGGHVGDVDVELSKNVGYPTSQSNLATRDASLIAKVFTSSKKWVLS